jgi:hypothetical protein
MHDIYNDYIYKKNINRFVSVSEKQNFPVFTSCPLEWEIFQISFVLQIIEVITLFLIIVFTNSENTKQEEAK